MSETQDRVSPAFVGEDKIGIQVREESFLAGNLVVQRAITLDFDYSAADPEGIALPLILEIQPEFGDGDEYRRIVFDRFIPPSFTFKVVGAGKYLILLKERFHNLYQGRNTIEITGDPFSDVQVTTRTA